MFLKNIFKSKRPLIKGQETNKPFNYKLERGLDCDEIPNTYGEFGKSPTNPIPVNGGTGELIYLNSLKDKSNQSIIYHRLTTTRIQGLDEYVDIYEVVSIDGKLWDILYFHMYHPRNSNKLPNGYEWLKYDKIWSHSPVGLGLNIFHPDFPDNMKEPLQKFQGLMNLSSVYEKHIKNKSFIRPQEHLEKLIHLNNRNNIIGPLAHSVAKKYPVTYFINLLQAYDTETRSFGLVCLQLNKENLTENNLASICKFAISNDDWNLNEIIIELVNHFDNDFVTQSIFKPLAEYLDHHDSKGLLLALNIAGRDFVKGVYFKIIPFLWKLTKHNNASNELIEKCNLISEEIILNMD